MKYVATETFLQDQVLKIRVIAFKLPFSGQE